MPTMRVACLLILISLAFAAAQERSIVPRSAPSIKALVIGINNYPRLEHLHNSVHDAQDFANMLEQQIGASRANIQLLTAEVNKQLLTKDDIERAAADFYRSLQPGDTAIFFYSGHGVQVENDPSPNFLIPSDISSQTLEVDLAEKAYPLSRIIKLMEGRHAGLRLLFVDACRNNPLIEEQRRVRAVGGGAVDPFRPPDHLNKGTVIGYAVSPGEKALDRSPNGRNGMYTYYLLRNLPRPGVDVIDALRDLAEDVHHASGETMTPSYYGNILARISLVAGAPLIVDRSPRVGDSRRNPMDGQVYKYIPAGTFRMGCSEGDNECYGNETPGREVTLTKGFWLGQTEVTVDAYRTYAKATGKPMPPEPKSGDRSLNSAWSNGRMPIVEVSWEDSRGYCEWAGGRLPTEAEWERAARAGSNAARYGSLEDVAWYGDNSGKNALDTAQIWAKEQSKYVDKLYENGNTFHGVGLKSPNAWGLYDMLGNVWEWVADWYGERYYASGERTDPQGPPNGEKRALRGGCWFNDPRYVRASPRDRVDPSNRYNDSGFRCAWE